MLLDFAYPDYRFHNPKSMSKHVDTGLIANEIRLKSEAVTIISLLAEPEAVLTPANLTGTPFRSRRQSLEFGVETNQFDQVAFRVRDVETPPLDPVVIGQADLITQTA